MTEAVSLDAFAAQRQVRANACPVCLFFREHPDLRAECDAGRTKPKRHSYANIAAYLREKHGASEKVTEWAVKYHYTHGERV